MNKILVPVDFSETSRRALRHALELGPSLGCEGLTVLHAALRPTEYLPLDDWIFGEHKAPKDIEKQVRDASLQSLQELLQQYDTSPVPLAPRVEFGPASATILDVAKAEHVDLIVIGTRGRNAKLLQRTAGSTAIRVIRAAPCPVLSVG